ncbi:MAG: hypothetical protein L0G49_03695 [Luteococcus sp.]|uniref:hypothetical protein n=1 Tax=Luteococcus sp. TaxID=1969402 RepID=UPI002649B231|nr:hypothetical protein [Luteococcus sp.]MDN5562872.1 hypothetical protein [Luteococcus sp.]
MPPWSQWNPPLRHTADRARRRKTISENNDFAPREDPDQARDGAQGFGNEQGETELGQGTFENTPQDDSSFGGASQEPTEGQDTVGREPQGDGAHGRDDDGNHLGDEPEEQKY